MVKTAKRKAGNESGAAAVEFAMVVPLLLTLVLGTMEAGMLFQLKNSMTFHTRAITREVALGSLDGSNAPAELTSRLAGYAQLNYNVSVTVPDPNDPNDTDVVVTVSVAQTDLEAYAITGVLVMGDYSTTATMRSLE